MKKINKAELEKLIDDINTGTASDEQILLYSNLFDQLQHGQILEVKHHDGNKNSVKNIIWARIEKQINRKHVIARTRTIKMIIARVSAIAASLLLIVGIHTLIERRAQNAGYVIKPGTNKAILGLGNGKKIFLDDALKGTIAKEAGIIINKNKNGEVIYTATGITQAGPNQVTTLNTITTPSGGQWHMILSDGTNVWLNSGSTITYPCKFKDDSRTVTLTGEAYFEVAKDKARPFHVKTAGQDIEVLGTHFNVNAYNDEPNTKTTLFEGSIRVSDRNEEKLIKPGEQSVFTNSLQPSLKIEKDADVDEAIAWKNGYFQFNNENVESIMRKISRWYDVDIAYNGDFSQMRFGGIISRSKNIRDVLNLMQSSGSIKFNIEGRRITVVK